MSKSVMDRPDASAIGLPRTVEDKSHAVSAAELLASPEPSGLSVAEAAERLQKDGPNELPSSKPRSVAVIAWEVIKEPIFLLLVACGAIYLFLGDKQEALMLLGFVFVVTGISFYQEHKTERTLEALRDLSSPRALVIRGGRPTRIPGREVVKGDLIVLSEGDRVPADARVLSSTNLSTDESLLTGESVPVRKTESAMPVKIARPGGDDLPFVYSGTLVVQGRAVAVVEAIGLHTEIGKIGKALQSVNLERTHLQQETSRWVRILAIVGGLLCLIVVLLHGLTRGSWLNGILSGLTLAMAILPNELPVVLTIFMALGAWRISKRHVLTRRVPVVETLGSASVLCVDKTGTLTMNQMSVQRLFAENDFYEVDEPYASPPPEKFHHLVEFSVLANQRDPFDPMERALNDFARARLADTEHLHDDWILVRQYPLSPALMALSQVWKSPAGQNFVIAAKGAPEAIVDLCHLTSTESEMILTRVSSMAGRGLRVLGVARAYFQRSELPSHPHDFDFEFLGLIGLADPVRPGVPDAVRECYSAGIQVVMITGDYAGTAVNIAQQIGLRNPEECITGAELDSMEDEELQRRVRSTNLFARVVPEQKLRLVRAFKATGQIVAMTGDGVNDAPALKAADIGIAMGGRGTDVAREAAALVLLDDNFSSIVHAVRLGRRIFDNLKKAIAYTLASHLPIIGLTLIPVMMKWPLILLPFHVAFLHLIIDPACSVVLEAEGEESTVMQHPPRPAKEPLFGRRTFAISILQGVSVLGVVLAVFAAAHYSGRADEEARALTFTTLVLANLALIFTNRSWGRTILGTLRSSNPALWWVVLGTVAFLGVVMFVPFSRDLFRFAVLHPNDFAICLGAAVCSILWFEIYKAWKGRKV
ncbi:MAG TPA: cation-translocating P-type ATPase [Candidatus Dormibacteraeota bacterium]|nr:cation-translocating P-type ATPase [Candidatus Dormibacteraeota bacterium]